MPDLNMEMARAAELSRERQQSSGVAEEKYNEGAERSRSAQQPSASISGAVSDAKNLTKAITPVGVFSALKQVDFLKDMPFFCAFGFAILKDILDVVFTATVILAPICFIFSILCSIFIFMMLMLAGANGKKKGMQGMMSKGMVLISGGFVDSIPGWDMAPIETFTVFVLYFMTLSERSNTKK